MKSLITLVILVSLCYSLSGIEANAARIKDIAQLHGVRNNQLLGYGLVTGLNGTGDDLKKSVFTLQAIYNMMTRQGITIDPSRIDDIKLKNVAAVMVIASLPPFAKSGTAIDVQVSSMGDSDSLAGGTLLMTPLAGPDGNVYAVAQGALTLGAFSFGGKAATVQKNHPTVGRIAGGAIVERSIDVPLGDDGRLQYQLRDADFTTSSNMAASVNRKFGQGTAFPSSPGTINVKIPESYKNNLVDFIATMEVLNVDADTPAKVVVNERTGTIVMGKDVRLSTVAVSHGNLSLIVRDDYNVSQPGPFARRGRTTVTPETDINVIEDDGELVLLDMQKGVSIGEIANALNAIGATPRDLIAIFQAIKASGSLYGELIIL
ncbi:MAG: flagellar basal body P-ring protein FlgI [Desulfovibrionaceae bacterium]|jgi:flagellar P-ring protein precursor FlgI|nr:flagellar basal body P-ring protein FlgI [Desulfovibrionaceae bacterium]